MIKKFAKVLKVDLLLIKDLEEVPVTVIVENKTVTNENNDKVINTAHLVDNSTNHFNPKDKVAELFERLLEKDQEKIDLLKSCWRRKNNYLRATAYHLFE